MSEAKRRGTGARPETCYNAMSRRIRELAEAIWQNSEDTSGALLNRWAYEIQLLTVAMAKMKTEEDRCGMK